MAPPAYGDLGKAARDLLNKHYHAGNIKLDVKQKTPTGVEFSINGLNNNDTGSIGAVLETKYEYAPNGITFKHKLSTDNVVTQEVTFKDYFSKGIKTGLLVRFAPQSGKKTGKVTCGYNSPFLNLNGDIDCSYSGAVLNGEGVFGYLGWLTGMKMTFDPSKNKIRQSNFAIGYQEPGIQVTGQWNDGQECICSIYQKINDELETSFSVAWSSELNISKFGVGCHYRVDKDVAIRAKFSNTRQIGLGLILRLKPNIMLALSTAIDANNFNHGSHKFGFGLEYNA